MPLAARSSADLSCISRGPRVETGRLGIISIRRVAFASGRIMTVVRREASLFVAPLYSWVSINFTATDFGQRLLVAWGSYILPAYMYFNKIPGAKKTRDSFLWPSLQEITALSLNNAPFFDLFKALHQADRTRYRRKGIGRCSHTRTIAIPSLQCRGKYVRIVATEIAVTRMEARG